MSAAQHTPGLFSGRHFPSAEAAALQFQYEASLRFANSRCIERFGPMRCASMQRDAAAMYAAARDALGMDSSINEGSTV